MLCLSIYQGRDFKNEKLFTLVMPVCQLSLKMVMEEVSCGLIRFKIRPSLIQVAILV